MPRISTARPEARLRLVRRDASYQQRGPLREAIGALSAEQAIELEPEPGETLRKLKAMVRLAAREAGRDVEHGETEQDTPLVWLAQPSRRRRRRQPPATGEHAAS